MPSIRQPGGLPSVRGLTEQALQSVDQLRDDSSLTPVLERALRPIVEALHAFASAQHEVNKRQWDRYLSLPQAHADTHLYGSDQVTGVRLVTVSVSSSYIIRAGDDVVVASAASGPITITLPAPALYANRVVWVKKIDSTVNVVTVAANGGTIDGQAVQYLYVEDEVMTLACDGVNWYII